MDQSQERQELRERLRTQMGPAFEQALDQAVDVYLWARVGFLIEDTEEPFDRVVNGLREEVQQAGLQERVEQIEATFSPSGLQDEAEKQRHG